MLGVGGAEGHKVVTRQEDLVHDHIQPFLHLDQSQWMVPFSIV